MNDKSYVSMEQHVCTVCGKAFDTGAILLNKRMQASMERHTTTGWGLCPEHQKLHDDGFVALVEADPAKSKMNPDGTTDPAGAWRTGNIAYIRRSIWPNVFNVPLAPKLPMVFCEPGTIDKLQSRVRP